MKYYIDQSGKIEDTAKNTILCIANGEWDTVLIKAKVKRQLQEIFRRHGQIRNFVLFTFCSGLSLLIKRHLDLGKIIIDKEYFGKEAVIKEIVLKMLGKKGCIPDLHFDLIGRRVKAHSYAYKTAVGKIKYKKSIGFEEILKEIKKTEVGKRLKNA